MNDDDGSSRTAPAPEPPQVPQQGGWALAGVRAFWGLVWLVWLLQPLGAAWDLRHTVAGVVGLVVVLAFAAGFVLHFLLVGPQPMSGLGVRSGRASVLGHLGLALLTVVGLAALGPDATPLLGFLAISAVWAWPLRLGLPIAVGLIGLLALLQWTAPGWEHEGGSLAGTAFGVLAVSLGMLAGRRRRELNEARLDNARLMVNQERAKLSRDLHDIVGHSLSVIAIKAELAERLAPVDAERAATEMAAVQQLSRDALVDVQRAVEGYRELSLPAEIAHAREVLGIAGIRADLPTATDDVAGDLRELFAWTVREAVTNVVRHSGAGHCRVTLTRDSVTVTDDGRGPSGPLAGRGLAGLRERAAEYGAVLTTSTLQPRGFRLRVGVRGAQEEES